MNELGSPRTCRPDRGTDPTKKQNLERHTTQHAGKVEAKEMGGGEKAHGEAALGKNRPPATGARRLMNFQNVQGGTGAQALCVPNSEACVFSTGKRTSTKVPGPTASLAATAPGGAERTAKQNAEHG